MRTDRYWPGCFLLLAMTAGLPAAAQTCGPWTRIGAEPPFGGASLNSVTHGEGIFVAVGDDGLVVTSPDGVAWTRHDTGETSDLRGVAWNGDRWVAVGGFGYVSTSGEGVILVSDDAASWRRVAVDSLPPMRSVTWSGSRFTAVGDGSALLTSADGESWERPDTSAVPYPWEWSLYAATCGGGFCVAGGGFEWTDKPTGTMLRSTDGLVWQPLASEYGFLFRSRDILWTGDRFVAAGIASRTPSVGWSTDGVSWEFAYEDADNSRGYVSVATDGDKIIAFGDVGRVQTSPNGITWTEKASALGTWVNDAVYADGRWVAVGYQGQTAVSEDGEAWAFGVPALFDSFSGRPAARNGSVTVAVGTDSSTWHGLVYRSVGGGAWQRSVLLDAGPFSKVAPYGGGFVALIWDGVASSPDGLTWTAHPLAPPSPGLEGLACSPVRCVAVGTEIVTSDDGETWTRIPLPDGGLAAHDVVWTGSRFVAIGQMPGGSTAMFLESTNGLSWTLFTEGGMEPPTTLAAHGDRLVALRGGQGRIFTTADGPPWDVIVLPSYDDMLEVVWTGSFFAALGTKPDLRHLALWASVDGTKWTELGTPSEQGRLGLAGFGSNLYIFGDSGTVLSATCTGLGLGRAPRRRLPAAR